MRRSPSATEAHTDPCRRGTVLEADIPGYTHLLNSACGRGTDPSCGRGTETSCGRGTEPAMLIPSAPLATACASPASSDLPRHTESAQNLYAE